MKKSWCFLLFFLLIFNIVYAHEGEENEIHFEDDKSFELEDQYRSSSVLYVVAASIIILCTILFSLFHKKNDNMLKWVLFLIIAINTLLVTFYVAGSTIYLNVISETKGPVHWHADFEVWNCGEKLDLIDPTGFSNRVGTSVFHEHGDDRIHVEGVLNRKEDARLSNFLRVSGGLLSEKYMVIPTNVGYFKLENGNFCNGEEGKLQVFLYKVVNAEESENLIYHQEKLTDFEDYILSPQSLVPPGDCIIIEFDKEKRETDKICETYKVAIENGELNGS